jgi:hypothetical protein
VTLHLAILTFPCSNSGTTTLPFHQAEFPAETSAADSRVLPDPNI